MSDVQTKGKRQLETGHSLRPDRLIPLPSCDAACRVEYCLGEGHPWTSATVYLGDSADDWRGRPVSEWNDACRQGVVPAGTARALWNCFFDVEHPGKVCQIRALAVSDGGVLWETTIDPSQTSDVTVIDHRHFGDSDLPGAWSVQDAGLAATTAPSLFRHLQREHRYLEGSDRYYRWVVTEKPEALTIEPGVTGWHRVYVAMEPCSSFELSFGPDAPAYEIPNPFIDSGDDDRFLQEFFIAEVDLTDCDIRVRPGGSRFWRDVSIRYIRLVPMSAAEVDHHQQVREMAAVARPFAGYLEPCTVAAYWPHFVQLRDHIRNEMQLNALRGSTDVYVHVIRIGCKSWYHSQRVEWDDSDEHYAGWMRDADPATVAVEEAQAAGLKVFLDAGMNATYVGADAHYAAYTSQFARQHPELLCPDRPMLFDYRQDAVQEYVAAIVNELMTRYDIDGVNLDFARWGHREAYDAPSLIQVLRRIDACRKEQERIRGRRLEISIRVPYEEEQDAREGTAPFATALNEWARDGLVDRFMVELQHEKLFQDKSLEHYRSAVANTATRFWGDMYWGSWYYGGGPQQDQEIARRLVERGVDGGFFYYMRGRPIEWESINWQLRLIDHPDLVVVPTLESHTLSDTP
ncbi:MAG: hypothetical protein HN712_27665 [Gemmatimonadetes bacterium]|nr:hypothetical protein [Gemmatimonadota bacterium]MBT6146211.1 hypothetical protein [Gemmatimonadota bacterium]MBT7864120.1 hypothetical protein [Gemmatimonadota bacterium]